MTTTLDELENDFGMDEDDFEEDENLDQKQEKSNTSSYISGNHNNDFDSKRIISSVRYQNIIQILNKITDEANNINNSNDEQNESSGRYPNDHIDKDINDERMKIKRRQDLGEKVDEKTLVLDCNKLVSEMEDEIMEIYEWITSKYDPELSELKSIASSTVQYAKLVLLIHEYITFEKAPKKLREIITQAQERKLILFVNQKYHKRQISEEMWEKIKSKCEDLITIHDSKEHISLYLKKQMRLVAPNLCQLLGPEVAVPFLGHAGGLLELVKIPAGNLASIGSVKMSQRKNYDVTSADNNLGNCTGTLTLCDILNDSPSKDFNKKCLRLIEYAASKAAKCDLSGTRPDGSYGQELRDGIYTKMDQFSAPKDTLIEKALPIPGNKRTARRGGWKARGKKRKTEYVRKLDELTKKRAPVSYDDLYYQAAENDGDEEEDYIFDNDIVAVTLDEKTKAKVRRLQIEEAHKQAERRNKNPKKDKKAVQGQEETEIDADFSSDHFVHQILHSNLSRGQRYLENATNQSLGMQSSMSSSLSGIQSGMSSSLSGMQSSISLGSNPLSNSLQQKKMDDANAKWFGNVSGKQREDSKK